VTKLRIVFRNSANAPKIVTVLKGL